MKKIFFSFNDLLLGTRVFRENANLINKEYLYLPQHCYHSMHVFDMEHKFPVVVQGNTKGDLKYS